MVRTSSSRGGAAVRGAAGDHWWTIWGTTTTGGLQGEPYCRAARSQPLDSSAALERRRLCPCDAEAVRIIDEGHVPLETWWDRGGSAGTVDVHAVQLPQVRGGQGRPTDAGVPMAVAAGCVCFDGQGFLKQYWAWTSSSAAQLVRPPATVEGDYEGRCRRTAVRRARRIMEIARVASPPASSSGGASRFTTRRGCLGAPTRVSR